MAQKQPKDPIDVIVGQRVRAARIRSGLTRDTVAAKLPEGLKIKTYGAIERGDRHVKPHEFAALAEALDATVEELLPPDPPPPAERQVNGVTVAEAGDTPAVAELSLAGALAAFTKAIDAQNDLLARQSKILERIERAIDRQDAAATKEAESRRGLLAAADVASQVLRDASLRQVAEPGTQPK